MCIASPWVTRKESPQFRLSQSMSETNVLYSFFKQQALGQGSSPLADVLTSSLRCIKAPLDADKCAVPSKSCGGRRATVHWLLPPGARVAAPDGRCRPGASPVLLKFWKKPDHVTSSGMPRACGPITLNSQLSYWQPRRPIINTTY